jgi:hypothetical protein
MAQARRVLAVALLLAGVMLALGASAAAAKVWRTQVRGGAKTSSRSGPGCSFTVAISTPSDLQVSCPTGARAVVHYAYTVPSDIIGSVGLKVDRTAGSPAVGAYHQALTRPTLTAVRVAITIRGPNTVDIRSVTIGYYVP